MAGKNKYVRRSRISETRFRALLHLFSLDLTAQNIAHITRLNRNTVNRHLFLIRERIALHCEAVSPILSQGAGAEDAADGKAAGAPIFGILRRGDNIYTELVPAYATPAVRAMLRGGGEDSLPAFSGYDCLVDMGRSRPFHARPSQGGAQDGHSLAGSFWSFALRRLAKFQGVPRASFYLHLKECEFRFNLASKGDPEACYRLLLKLLRENPLN